MYWLIINTIIMYWLIINTIIMYWLLWSLSLFCCLLLLLQKKFIIYEYKYDNQLTKKELR